MEKLESGILLHNRYRIIHALGKGGMGMVYLADDTSLDRRVAVKENYGIGEDSSNQFLQEARLLAALRHPHLPRVTDYFIDGPLQYLVMDYLPGDDLQTVLEREGRQPVSKVLGWSKQLVDALTYMHIQSPPVTHRDIKPANIRLREDGSAVLVDFGIAKAAESAQKTNTGAMGYTPGFAPPEQAGGGRTGPYSDQFSLAATIYTLLSGSRPVESIKRVLEGARLEDPRSLNPDIPENIAGALVKAMSIHPENRFQDMQSFFLALQNPDFRWSEGQVLKLAQTPKRDKRPAWMLASFGLIGLLVIAILGVSLIAIFGLLKPVDKTMPANSYPDTTLSITPEIEVAGFAETQAARPSLIHQTPLAQKETAATSVIEPTIAMLASGKWIAFSSDRADGSTLQIWLMQIGLNNEGKPVELQQKQLTTTPGNKTQAAWSPDGKFLLYSAPSVEKTNGLDIWRIPIDGGEAVDLSNRKGDDLFAAWSPDGKLINYSNSGRDDGILQLFMMDSNGGNQQRISTDYEESQGIWSPDMRMLFYVISASDNHYFYQRSLQGEYKTPQPYDNSQVFGRLGQVADPAFSPDGTLLAFTRFSGRDQRIGVAEYQSKGAVFTLITKTGKDYDPAWSPDGKWITFTSERDGNPEIYLMSSAGLIQTNVSQSASRDLYPVWQP